MSPSQETVLLMSSHHTSYRLRVRKPCYSCHHIIHHTVSESGNRVTHVITSYIIPSPSQETPLLMSSHHTSYRLRVRKPCYSCHHIIHHTVSKSGNRVTHVITSYIIPSPSQETVLLMSSHHTSYRLRVRKPRYSCNHILMSPSQETVLLMSSHHTVSESGNPVTRVITSYRLRVRKPRYSCHHIIPSPSQETPLLVSSHHTVSESGNPVTHVITS